MNEETIIMRLAKACDCSEIITNPQLNLLDEGVLDSLAMINFLEILEEELDIEVQPTQITQAEWNTPQSVATAILKTAE